MENNKPNPNAARVKRAKQLSHNELARQFVEATIQLETWVEVAMALAAYYIHIEPHADIFNGSTFNPDTLKKIKDRSVLTLKDVPYSRVIYLTENDPDRLRVHLPVDVFDPTNDEQVREIMEKINKEKGRQEQNERDDPPSDCFACQFSTSCSESMTRTGLRVYDCKQFAPLGGKNGDQ